ncbi:MAG: TAT-variant-translocated molybdopterin oxidoreductase [Gemmatimonadota bacterium]|nr:MAG: TAT-variant-translocated molybdopterin oxidoreductase [Gemmatimonadota bacterium]
MSEGASGIDRRGFLKVVGVTGAGAGVAGCSTQKIERLLPYVVPPEEITPGVATWYTTVCGECPAGCGMWVRTREGRVVKVEGNPRHPISSGALCSKGHASLQGLYNPDRFAGPMVRDATGMRQISWDEAEQLLADRLGDGDYLFLTGSTGPTFGSLLDGFVSATGGTRVEYDALSEAPLREATRLAFGRNVVPSYDLEAARLIVSFGADFLTSWLSPVAHGRGLARMSSVDGDGRKGRLVLVGPRLSLTGQNADDWLPITPGSEALVALAMANVISGGRNDAGPYAEIVRAYTPRSVAQETGVSADKITELAERFAAAGPSLALGPGFSGQHRNATASNLAVLVLNFVAGNVGRTVSLNDADLGSSSAPYRDMETAIRTMAGGGTQAVLVHGCNPAHSLPASSGFVAAFEAVPFRVVFASSMNETAEMADLVLPDRNFLESWGDSNPRPGLHALSQPAMQPVPNFDSKQSADVLLSVATLMGSDLGASTFYDYLRASWRGLLGGSGSFETAWREALKNGVLETGAPSGSSASLRSPDAALVFDVPAFDGDGDFHLMVHPSAQFGDGALNGNRPWLLELPDPVSKLTWHSWVEMNPNAAERLGLRDGDVVTLASEHGSVEVPVWTYPGIREDVVALAMGSGHTGAGRFVDGNGVNAMALLPADTEEPSGALVNLATRVSITPTGERRHLATIVGATEQHERGIAPAVAIAELGLEEEGEAEGDAHGRRRELQGVGGFVPVETDGEPEDFPLPGAEYGVYENAHDGPRWGMAIDLDKCTGCSACVTACQSENNVPWVGESQIIMGREMHWIRIERYYETVRADEAGPVDIRFLPMLCQQCGNAPCEPVCPVYATYHNPEGLNVQVYNRCVGTRYCANNCPYKLRVFNWYGYTSQIPEPMNMQFNPDVTVRDNGVMEKCSFCIQRIREVQNRIAVEGREMSDGEVVPACQQSCPAEAIVFGDVRDKGSRVAQITQNERTYRVLDSTVNTQPAVTYLKKVTFHEVESGES